MKWLVIAPHPDDEVLGCGGIIAKYSEDIEIHVCVVTETYPPDWTDKFRERRKKEIKNVKKILEIDNYHFLNYPTVKLDTIEQKELCDSITEVVQKVKPNVVFIPHSGDLNKDHRLVFESSLVATRPHNNSLKKILSYETLSETEWGQPLKKFKPNVYEDISNEIETKIKAMKAYKSELKEHPHPRSIEGIKSLAKKRGSEVGLNHAESFQLIREVNEMC